MSIISAAVALREVTTAMGVADLFPTQSVPPTGQTAQQPISVSLVPPAVQKESPLVIPAAVALKEGTGVAPKVVPMQRMPPMTPATPMVNIGAGTSTEDPPVQSSHAKSTSASMEGPAMQSSIAPSTLFMTPSAGNIPPKQSQDGPNNLTPLMPSTQPKSSKPNGTSFPLDPSQPAQNQPPSKPTTKLAPTKEKQPKPNTTSDEKQPLTSTTKPPPDEAYEPADSALPFMVISLFSLLFSTAWFFVKIPFKIGFSFVTFWSLIIGLRIAWLFLADDNGAWEMGAGVDYEYNMPGIY